MLVVLDFDVVRRFYRLGRRESRLARLLLPDHADMRHAVRLPERGREEIRAAHDADLDDVTGKVELEIGLENLFNERRALTSSRRMNTRDSSSLRVKTRRKGRFPLLSCCQAHLTGELSLSGSS
jgi:hypothetical protein